MNIANSWLGGMVLCGRTQRLERYNVERTKHQQCGFDYIVYEAICECCDMPVFVQSINDINEQVREELNQKIKDYNANKKANECEDNNMIELKKVTCLEYSYENDFNIGKQKELLCLDDIVTVDIKNTKSVTGRLCHIDTHFLKIDQSKEYSSSITEIQYNGIKSIEKIK